MNARAELEQLLADVFDNPPDEMRNQKLREMLHAHPELQEPYLEQVHLHALLQWRGGVAVPKDLPRHETEKAVPAPAANALPTRGWTARRGLTAALLFMVATVAVALIFLLPEAQARPDLVESLVDWNLNIAQMPLVERDGIYAGQVESLKATLAKGEFSRDDRSIAAEILDNSNWLTKNDDPIAKAHRFNEIADKLVDRLVAVTATRDESRIVKAADAYRRLAEQGVDANVERVVAIGFLNIETKAKLEKVQLQDEMRAKKLEQIIERNPEPARKTLRRILKGHHPHKGKKFFKTIN
ncbi:MAG: hypothetical protein EXR98_02860 [Gemmataceae bacterium]|nr:hypothetical protein [Gemmataceae bacterium]